MLLNRIQGLSVLLTSVLVAAPAPAPAPKCGSGYSAATGANQDIPDWGSVNGRGGGETVAKCSDCEALCDAQGDACQSTECSPTELKCNLNSAHVPTVGPYKDYTFCMKNTGMSILLRSCNLNVGKLHVIQ